MTEPKFTGFSDEDLRILKANAQYWDARTASQPNLMLGLIARLECAEAYIDDLQGCDECNDNASYQAWLRSKGLTR